MATTDRTLTLLLRFLGVTALFALVAVIMPKSWITNMHEWLGLGDMPMTPVVEYLARSDSMFYALFGALCLVLTADLPRYRPLVRLLGVLMVVMGVAFIGIDLAAGMPWWWSALEGPQTIVFGSLIFYLARPCK